MKKHHILLPVLVFVLLIPGTFIVMYNRLVSAEKKVEELTIYIIELEKRMTEYENNIQNNR